MNLVQKFSVGIAGTSLALMMAVAPAAAQTNQVEVIEARNGAAGLVAAVVDANVILNDVLNDADVAVVELNDSLNNLRALNNVLNNSPILSNNNVEITDVVDIQDVIDDVTIQDFLNDNNIAVNDVVSVAILSGGDFILFTQ